MLGLRSGSHALLSVPNSLRFHDSYLVNSQLLLPSITRLLLLFSCVSTLGLLNFLRMLKKKKYKMQVKFYLEQNEDYSLGDSISDSFERLLQRGLGEKINI